MWCAIPEPRKSDSSIRIIGTRLRLALADNGGGLPSTRSIARHGRVGQYADADGEIGGRFSIASQTGRGTTVRFYLPLN